MIGMLRKIEREARMVYDPNMTALAGLFAGLSAVAVPTGEMGLFVFGSSAASAVVWKMRRNDLRWRDLEGLDAESQSE